MERRTSTAGRAAQLMLPDVIKELRSMAAAAKADATTGSGFKKGRQFGLYEALSLISDEADAFGLDRVELGLDDFDADKEVLGI